MRDRRVRGDHQVEIADHGRGVHERTGHFIQPAGKVKTGKSTAATCSDPYPFCKLISRTPDTRASGANWANGIERQRSDAKSREPCQTMPTLKPSIPASSFPHRSVNSGSAAR